MANTTKATKIKIAAWNACSLTVRKAGELKQFAEEQQADIIIISESGHKMQRPPPRITNYNVVYNIIDENNTNRGVAMYVKYDLPFIEKHIETETLENVSIEADGIQITGIYSKPKNKIDLEDLHEIFQNEKVIAVGDWNAHNMLWDSHSNNQAGRMLEKYTEDYNLIIWTPEDYTRIPTNNMGAPTIIDFAITKGLRASNITAHYELSSDHNPITIQIQGKWRKDIIESGPKWKYNEANWREYREQLNRQIRINREINNIIDIENATRKITTQIQEAAQNHIPKRPPLQRGLPQEILDHIKDKNRTRRLFQRHRTEELLEELRFKNKLTRELIYSWHEKIWHDGIRKTQNDKMNVWRHLKNRKRQLEGNTQNKPLIVNGKTITTAAEKAEVMAEHYRKQNLITRHLSDLQTTQLVDESYETTNRNTEAPNDKLTSPSEIRRILKKMPTTKAPGEDDIQGILLKNLPKKAIVQLHYLFNACLRLQYFPQPWKKARIIPIPKAGKNHTRPENLRPISLLSNMGKTFEKIIYRRLMDDIENRNLIIQEQFGFTKHKDTTGQVARIVDKAMINFNLKKYTSLTTLDLEKAYDTVWRKALSHKMLMAEIPPYLTKTINSYLNDRRIKVTIQNEVSEEKNAEEGLPQGSVLSPVLFNLYVNDIPRNERTTLAMYADDTAIVAEATHCDLVRAFTQNHIDELVLFFNKWKLKINAAKTETMLLTKRRNTPIRPLVIEGEIIEESREIKYLGIVLDKGLTFGPHIMKTRRRAAGARRMLWPYIEKTNPLDRKLKIALYKTYIRPILTYGAPVWNSTAKHYLKKLQAVETSTLRIIEGKSRTEIRNQDLYDSTNIMPLPDKVTELTEKFFNEKVKRNDFTAGIGTTKPEDLPVIVKHKLIYRPE